MEHALSRPLVKSQPALVQRRHPWLEFWRRYSQNRLAVIGLIIALGMVFTGIFAPWLAPYSYTQQDLRNTEQMPSLAHPLGTDRLGRDQLSRVIWGARTAIIVAPSATIIWVVLGLILGTLAGYFSGIVDSLIMRLADVFAAFPGLLFAILLAFTIQPRISTWLKGYEALKDFVRAGYVEFLVVIFALSLIGWTDLARLVRGQILTLKNEAFVEAARATGVTEWRIMMRHLLPNALPPIIVALSMGMGGAIVAESTLSFLGIGIQPPTASWGAMINENRIFWRHPAGPVLLWIPGLIVATLIFAFNYIGDGLNDALNPRLE